MNNECTEIKHLTQYGIEHGTHVV